jgi:hypothetical protein
LHQPRPDGSRRGVDLDHSGRHDARIGHQFIAGHLPAGLLRGRTPGHVPAPQETEIRNSSSRQHGQHGTGALAHHDQLHPPHCQTLAPSADAGIVSPGGFVVGTGQALNLACLRQWR